MTSARYPRLGEREDLRIELTPSALSTYRQTRLESAGVELSTPEAAEELEDVLRESYVTYSSGEAMRVRARVRRLEVDVEAQLLRVHPDHARVLFASARRYDTQITKAGSGRGKGGHSVYSADLSRRIGYLRVTPRGTLEWRDIAESSGAAPPPWGPMPPNIRELALEQERAGQPRTARWLRKHGIEL